MVIRDGRGGDVVPLAGAARAILFIEQNRVATFRAKGRVSGQGPCATGQGPSNGPRAMFRAEGRAWPLYTSDAADDLPCVDLGGRRVI